MLRMREDVVLLLIMSDKVEVAGVVAYLGNKDVTGMKQVDLPII